MSKMSALAQTIEELRNAATAITDAANWLVQQFSETGDAEPSAESEPKKKVTLTLEQVRAVLADKSRAGHTAQVRALLERHGADKLSQIDPQEYEVILQEAEEFDHAT